jgi:hypothetical protein
MEEFINLFNDTVNYYNQNINDNNIIESIKYTINTQNKLYNNINKISIQELVLMVINLYEIYNIPFGKDSEILINNWYELITTRHYIIHINDIFNIFIKSFNINALVFDDGERISHMIAFINILVQNNYEYYYNLIIELYDLLKCEILQTIKAYKSHPYIKYDTQTKILLPEYITYFDYLHNNNDLTKITPTLGTHNIMLAYYMCFYAEDVSDDYYLFKIINNKQFNQNIYHLLLNNYIDNNQYKLYNIIPFNNKRKNENELNGPNKIPTTL